MRSGCARAEITNSSNALALAVYIADALVFSDALSRGHASFRYTSRRELAVHELKLNLKTNQIFISIRILRRARVLVL